MVGYNVIGDLWSRKESTVTWSAGFFLSLSLSLLKIETSFFEMGPQGLYLNKWTPSFDPTQDVPSAVLVWVQFPHLPLHCWNSESLETIENKLGKYIDREESKD